MLSRMLGLLINNLHLVEKLAESRPIRRAAQITAYAITKAQIAGRDTSKRVLQSETLRQRRKKVELDERCLHPDVGQRDAKDGQQHQPRRRRHC
uniref:NCBP2 antisense 2 (head to head) n=1 Tax=Oryzias melastigma TaxID=30732 RepID=A0A3B3BWR7_ORYME